MYKVPRKSLPVPIIGHSGELVVPVKQTKQLFDFVKSKQIVMPKRLKSKLLYLLIK